MRVLGEFRRQWIGVLGLLVGLTGVTFGATGQPALLGKLNQADKPTQLENTATGPAATFKTKATAPPFTVTSGKQVPNLNASRLAGKLPSAFAGVGSSYTKAQSDGKYAPASGSPNYRPASLRTLMAERFDPLLAIGSPDTSNSTEFQLTAPGSGTLTLRVSGRCGLDPGFLRIGMGVGTINPPPQATFEHTVGGSAEGCNLEASLAVAEGDFVGARVSVQNTSGGTMGIQAWTANVEFLPD